jgi:pyridoxine kinase
LSVYNRLPRVAAIHDLSGYGKCSLTVALPILSACGIEVSCMPTAVLSTHTGGFSGYTFRDLTQDLRPFFKHWQSLGLSFDAIYSGYLGSYDQIGIVADVFSAFHRPGNLLLVDPVMADNGKLYSLYTLEMAGGMAELCKQADVIVPNMTEAAFLLGESYIPGPYTKEYLTETSRKLAAMGAKSVVLTGVYYGDESLGASCYDRATGEFSAHFSPRINGFYHGTGDIFASTLLAALMNNRRLPNAVALAVDFTYSCILRSAGRKTDDRCGVDFEHGLWRLGRLLTQTGTEAAYDRL